MEKKQPPMQAANPESKARLLILLGVPVLLFGGFAVSGITERARQNAPDSVESPAKLSAERREIVEKQREAFALRKQMATLGKRREWQRAAGVATDEFLARNSFRNLRFLRAEAWLRAGDKRGGNALRDAVRGDNNLSAHEADLLAGSVAEYRGDVINALRNADSGKIAAPDANNLAWQAALVPGATDAANLRKAVGLSEGAVNAARNEGDRDMLATYTNTLGALRFRAGLYKDAVRVLTESESLNPDPFNAPFLCLAYRRQGDAVNATLWQVKLENYLNSTFATRDGQKNRHQLLLFWQEVQESAPLKVN